jgi:hypothetical protein
VPCGPWNRNRILLPPISEQLARTAPLWARRVLPVAQQLAANLLESERQHSAEKTRSKPAQARNQTRRVRRAQRIVTREYRPRVDPDHDSRRSPAAGVKRRRAMAKVVAANKQWEGADVPADIDYYRVTVAPGLHRLKLKTIMAATGLTKGACSRIRTGEVVPHPRHWAALGML